MQYEYLSKNIHANTLQNLTADTEKDNPCKSVNTIKMII